MTQQTNGMPGRKYSKEIQDEMYEALKLVLPSLQTIGDKHGNRPKHITDKINIVTEALAKAEGNND